MRHATRAIAGVQGVAIDLDRGLVDVELAAGNRATPAQLRAAIARCGFDAREMDLSAAGRFVGERFAISNTPVELRATVTRPPQGPVIVDGVLDSQGVTLTVRTATAIAPEKTSERPR